jgi:hypothetical protein
MNAKEQSRSKWPSEQVLRYWELFWWIMDLNPGLCTENWRVLDTQLKLKGQWLILLVDWD